ncbi:MAG: hypothetical protein U0074_04400 [Kouleothrix sp.]
MREQLAFSAADLQVALADLRNYASEGFIISTCNRVEIGGLVADDWHGPEALLHFLADHHGVPLAHLLRTCMLTTAKRRRSIFFGSPPGSIRWF